MTYEEQTEEAPFSPEMEAGLFQIVLDRSPEELDRLAKISEDSDAFTYLPRAAAAAFHLGRFEEARILAERTLSLAPAFQRDWNYGNATHIGHTVLGLLALASDNHPAALAELHASGETPGSPQLNSFGPTMQLAKALLKAGHVEPVLLYLEQCRAFWEMGGTWLDLWQRKIREGQVPNFFQHSYV